MENENQTDTGGNPASTMPPQTELACEQLDKVIGGLQFIFRLVAVKTISWSHDG